MLVLIQRKNWKDHIHFKYQLQTKWNKIPSFCSFAVFSCVSYRKKFLIYNKLVSGFFLTLQSTTFFLHRLKKKKCHKHKQ